MGQYVVLLRRGKRQTIGGDASLEALRAHRKSYPLSPLLVLDLRQIPFVDDSLQAHVSIGVVEHVERGPRELLREFCRTLGPRGVLILTVPWVNGYRGLFRRRVLREQSARREAGALFHQYAYTRSEIRSFLEDAGFRLDSFHPYSPARGLGETPVLGRLSQLVTLRRREPLRQLDNVARPGLRARGLRRLLYWPPVLWTVAHMILAVAHKMER